ncbi:MAG: Excinuclease ABC subunit C [uncultured bacterium]|uniref:Excinuclease ABC subunit C n=4 Tax=Candidatus Daviesiibacteriota TaxID=1752718 RepID=A0A0G0ERZ5_9BACT|nr:MAG: Excinuclease ABC subunit C [uncultured bacterium]KKQ08287.1 MAG: Excinuclease ABC subunit C [Candidatus Daviesbacteria bacterium GW2011_GWB1_36_5]KKQ15562.1 MAG: Excinuclease ABC subunit C [Candidatus Daviesbacteria bacterium GW2011_GWA1_36_8]OGE17546.1 MAG: hypothetical protein A2858_01435 [Candidatus Daviesbacteria bacterium RIFCSPHIGHO2_01_FULL_36_37]OGE36640.1 MAG: hypothetical protein A3E66_03280 [Candidatus Daviesbacteria bacterium RIFCSPHIGHO2_12_FULL_37_16]
MLKNLFDKNNLPHKPGIYIYKNAMGRVIYVGKAVDLFSRVSSYFSGRLHDLKTSQLIGNIASVETIVVESEIEALILEANLIKQHLPLYNIRLTDDKDYLYIAFTREDFPRVLTARRKDLPAGRQGVEKYKKYFGPYPSSKTVKETLKKLRRIFPWCSMKSEILNMKYKKNKPCFYYHLGLCMGPCAGVVRKDEYNKMINRFSMFMDGKKEELLDELTAEMVKRSEEMKFEEADQLKKIIGGINYITQPTSITKYLENPNFLEDMNKQSLEALQKDLNLPELPERIEGYDISNFGGKEATGSMVVLINGEIDKSQYRKFKIKITGRPNDVGMHKEMMRRRLKHKEWLLPQLILVDGGRGQVRGAEFEIRNLKFEIPIFGLAKRMEWLYPPEGEVVKLPKRSLSLRLLQKIRDESHRFAITYHRKLRKKSLGI